MDLGGLEPPSYKSSITRLRVSLFYTAEFSDSILKIENLGADRFVNDSTTLFYVQRNKIIKGVS